MSTAPTAPTTSARLLHAAVAAAATLWLLGPSSPRELVLVPLGLVLLALASGACAYFWPAGYGRLALPIGAALLAMRLTFALGLMAGVWLPPFAMLAAGLAALVVTARRLRTHSLTLAWARRRSA